MPEDSGRICYLCGEEFTEEDEITRDHVPPKNIFPSPIRQAVNLSALLTLQAHRDCNESYSQDEGYFRTSLAALVSDERIWDAVSQDIRRAAEHPESRRLIAAVADGFSETVPGTELVIPGRAFQEIDSARISRVVWKIARGLYFHHHAEVLDESVKHQAFVYAPDKTLHPPTEAQKTIATFVLTQPNRGEYGQFFAYKYYQPQRNINWVWAFLFWDSFIYICWHHPSDCEGENCTCRP